MKRIAIVSLLASVTIFAQTATAGELSLLSVSPTPIEPPMVVASGANWQGFYAGGQFALGQGELESYINGVQATDLFTEGSLYGGFMGYNFQTGNLVFGAEASYMLGELADPSANPHELTTEGFLDLKARAGYATGSFLLFGFAGYSTATIPEIPGTQQIPSIPSLPLSGLNYGVGVDYQINDRIFVGVDYTMRNLAGDLDQTSWPGWTIEGPISTLGFRLGANF